MKPHLFGLLLPLGGFLAFAGCTSISSESSETSEGGLSNEGGLAGSNLADTTPPLNDGKKNGDESDVDCGGTKTGAPRCGTGKGCNVAEDCDSKVCSSAKKCVAPTSTDNVRNGDETDVDCGGTTTGAPKCAAAKACATHADCASDGCDDQNKCAVSRSCTQTNGGRTCGTGEVGTAQANHESCCIALPIPGQATQLDKYKVTAGRMRASITRVKGDVKGWYTANKATLPAVAVSQIEAWKDTLPTDLDTPAKGANYQLGGFVSLPDQPSESQGCYVGNAGDRANGSHTYWNGKLEGEDRAFDQAFLDRLPLNCVPYPIMAAFCAWDGGRLQTYAENSAAYGPGFYPWGNAPEAYGFYEVGGKWQPFGPARFGAPHAACPGCDTSRMNWLNSYQFPEGGGPAKPWDYAYFISAPGRFPLDSGAGGHKDLGALMMEFTATPGKPHATHGATIKWSRAGSWEVHEVNKPDWMFPIMTKYGKVGGRCARN